MAESDQFALNASVAPVRVLVGHPQHQGAEGLWGGWAAGLSSWVGPAAGDEVGVPAQQGSGCQAPGLVEAGFSRLDGLPGEAGVLV